MKAVRPVASRLRLLCARRGRPPRKRNGIGVEGKLGGFRVGYDFRAPHFMTDIVFLASLLFALFSSVPVIRFLWQLMEGRLVPIFLIVGGWHGDVVALIVNLRPTVASMGTFQLPGRRDRSSGANKSKPISFDGLSPQSD